MTKFSFTSFQQTLTLFVACMLIISVGACKKNNNTSDLPKPSTTQAKIDNRTFIPTNSGFVNLGSGIQLYFTDKTNTITVYVPAKTSGNYPVCQSGVNCFVTQTGATASLTTAAGIVYTSVKGTISTVVEADGTIKGTYNFEAKNNLNNAVNITEGSFINVPFLYMPSHSHTCHLFFIPCPIVGEPERDCQKNKKGYLGLSLASKHWLTEEPQEVKRKDFDPQRMAAGSKRMPIKREKRLKFPYPYCPTTDNRLPLERGQNKT